MYKKAETCRKIRKLMEGGMRYSRACLQVVKTYQTIENWRNKKSLLDRYFLRLLDRREDRITDAVEDKLSDRLLKGEATPTEYIFYLVNRRPKKWQNNYRLEHSGKVDGGETKIIIIHSNGKQDAEKDRLISQTIPREIPLE